MDEIYSGTIIIRIQIFADELYKLLPSTWFLITLHELMPFVQTYTVTEVVDIYKRCPAKGRVVLCFIRVSL